MIWPKSITGFVLVAAWLPAADLKVYSEFRRIGPDGEIVAADRGGTVSEILSPRALRGGWTSFQIVVEAPAGTEFWLYLGQNPDNAARISLYRASFTKGIPDGLVRVDEPASGKIPAGQQAAVFWVDLQYPKDGPAGRVKFEPQLFLSEEKRWLIYPMEVNITPARAQVVMENVSGEASLTGRADDIALAVVRSHACPGAPALKAAKTPAQTVRDHIERNARQDVSLLRRLAPAALARALPADFCEGTAFPPEGMLRMRNRIYKLLEESSKLKETDP